MEEKIFSPGWVSTKKAKPQDGTIVEALTAKHKCRCGGAQRVECYYENGIFKGIKHQAWVDYWRVSPANEMIKELSERQLVCAADCNNCLV